MRSTTRVLQRPPLLITLIGVLLALPLGCRRTEPASQPHVEGGATDREGHGEEHEGDRREVVRVSPEQRAEAGITLEAAGPGTIDAGVELLGEVHPNGDRLAHIAPRFPGIAREVRKTIGDAVKAGQVLAVIESSESLAPYELKTLIDGTIIEKHLTRGEAVDRDKPRFVVADLSSVWVDMSVYQRDLHRIRLGQPVRVHSAEGDTDADGSISYITPAVDPVTRTATARVVMANADRHWRPGMFVTARALEPVAVPLAVPRAALQTVEGRPVLFVERPEGLEPRPVALGREGDTHVEVLSGIAAGERFAATNTFVLKAEIGKAEAEHEH